MKTALTLALLIGLANLPASAGESGDLDHEAPLVKEGVLGTVNVLREWDLKTWTNRVTVRCNVEGRDSTQPEYTIDGSGRVFRPNLNPPSPLILTYALAGLRTVSSMAIQYEHAGSDAPQTVRLEGSADGGQTWFKVFQSAPRKSEFQKLFKPAKVNALRLTQEGGGGRTTEVFLYADPEVSLPLFGGVDSGSFNFLRDLWYAGKIRFFPSRGSPTWAAAVEGKSHALFMSEIPGAHGLMCWGEGEGLGKRIYLRLDLDKAYPMNYGVIGCVEVGKNHDSWTLAGESQAEFYTANGQLDPSTLNGSSIKDLTGQGWILQKAWENDVSLCKPFTPARPGTYKQMLVVWDCHKKWENNRWSRLEMFGVESPDAGSAPAEPQK